MPEHDEIKEENKQDAMRQPQFDIGNADFFEFNNDDDDILLNFLKENPYVDNQVAPVLKEVPAAPPSMILQPSVQNVQNVQNIAQRIPTVIPKMYFPGSNVTINYNFQSK